MKLAEALILRADYQKRIEQLRHRLTVNAKVQEGDQPNEDPEALMEELKDLLAKLQDIIQKINKTNVMTAFDDKRNLADVLTQREILAMERNIYSNMLDEANIRMDRYSRSEIKYVSTIDVKETQKYVDDLSKKYRELDIKIQELNWKTDLIEN